MVLKDLLEVLHPDMEIILFYQGAKIDFYESKEVSDFWKKLKIVPGTVA